MPTAIISIQVDEEAARAFATASTEERRKIELLLRLRLQDLILGSQRPLKVVMDEIGEQAEARGLTPEILESLLRDE
jgi:hypothetical protein